jgi:hypothetical protein
MMMIVVINMRIKIAAVEAYDDDPDDYCVI